MASPALQLAENERTAKKARIRRGSARARQAVNRLDREVLGDLEGIYRQAAADIETTIRGYGDATGNLRLEVLRDLQGQVNQRLAQLETARDELLEAGLVEASRLGVRPFQAEAISASLNEIADEAVRFTRAFVAEDGLQLSDRLWRIDQGAREALAREIQSAIVQGHSASQATNDFLQRGEAVPAALQRKMEASSAERVARATGRALLRDDDNARFKARRVLRTEINRAHGEAYMLAGEEDVDFGGFRYLLSPAHPRPDICDMHARANIYGLGPGVYPSRDKTPWPAHPNILSYVEIVFADEISADDRAGKEGRIEWLKRQPAGIKEAVLGSRRKRAALNAGILRDREIATPWKVLKQRYERRGIDVDALVPAPAVDVPARPGSASAARRNSIEYVLGNGRDSGWEHAYIYDAATGDEVLKKTSRATNYVQFTAAQIRRMEDARRPVVVSHNHPSLSSLSLPDLTLTTLDGVQEIIAVGHNGTVYTGAARVANRNILARARAVADDVLRRRVWPLVNDGTLSADQAGVYHSHVANLALQRAGLIDYSVDNVSGHLQDALALVGDNATDQAVRAALDEIRSGL